jgi:DNA (cytosine-5)-methyltransferase 1
MLNHGFQGRLGHLSETVIDILQKDLGYSVAVKVLLAADYGVPQLRERAIFIARANGTASFPEPTHIDPTLIKDGVTNRKPWVTVKEAIGDLPAHIRIGDRLGGSPISSYLPNASDYALDMQSQCCFPSGHVTREYRKSVLELISNMKPGETWDNGSARMRKHYQKKIKQLAKEANIPEDVARSQLVLAGKINETFYKDYYWSAYTRLAWDAPALTITANANFLGSGRFTHPDEMRGITVREAARLQSFDDDFQFVTSDNSDADDEKRIGVAMDMIGEAVPPKLAQALAEHISAQLGS